MSTNRQFKPGDLVNLKSGSPSLIVIGYIEGSEHQVVVEWFVYGTTSQGTQREVFDDRMLIAVKGG